MVWSFSASRSFKRCQVQWLLATMAGHHNASDPIRRRALFFGKLTTVSAWRGQLVDTVISSHIIPAFGDPLDEDPMGVERSKRIARSLFDRQLAYAREHRAATVDVKLGDVGEHFALLFEFEFGSGPAGEDLDRAWAEIEQALENFWANDTIQGIIHDAAHLVTQPRKLHFQLFDRTKAAAIPDLIAFRNGKPPVIVDWKVHAEVGNSARRQLAVYAVALKRSTQHKDFPDDWNSPPTQTALVEAQLLLGQTKQYRLTEDDVAATTAYMDSSAYEMNCLTGGKTYKDIEIADFRLAHSSKTCASCVFQSICPEVVQ